ncbi:MAG: CBS and ACT domain-containing protein [Thermodesulfobacteriota bacterium]|nr:CBS and ACT domain-containing protein [Thermodesulfobacteriota bacterium]
MLIKEWMSRDLVIVDENTSLMRATRVMKENNIRRLPVLGSGKLAGILSDRDVKDASPSKMTAMDIHEFYYFLSEMKVKDAMTSTPLTLYQDDLLERAAILMLKNKISGVPVLDESGNLVGLLSSTDVVRGFIHSTGIEEGTILIVFNLQDEPGWVTGVIKVLRENNASVIGIRTDYKDAQEGMKKVAVRINLPDKEKFDKLIDTLSDEYEIIYHMLDRIDNLPGKTSD